LVVATWKPAQIKPQHMAAIAHNLTKRRDRSFRSPNPKRSKNNSIMGKKKQGISIMLV
jgi:hypothetical protein